MEDEQYETLSLRARRKKPSVSLSCCFNGHRHSDSFDATSSIMPSPSSRISPSLLKGRYKNLISRMGRHRRHSSADFSYDPLSYSLNFEDNDHHHDDHSEVEEFPIRSFASRLPLSPPGRPTLMVAPPPPPSPARRTMISSMPQRASDQLGSTSRAAAVAEVRKSLEEAKPRPPVMEARRSLELPSPRKLEEMRRISAMGEARKSLDITTPRKVETNAAETRGNVDLLTPRAEVRRNYDYEEVSPALVVSPTSRQVLVELC